MASRFPKIISPLIEFSALVYCTFNNRRKCLHFVKVIPLKMGRIIFKVTDFHGINQIKTLPNTLIYNYLTILLTHY